MNEELICQVVEKAVREAGKAVMTLETAKKLIGMVEKKAEEMGIAVIIAVADKAARPVAIHCMDDAYIARAFPAQRAGPAPLRHPAYQRREDRHFRRRRSAGGERADSGRSGRKRRNAGTGHLSCRIRAGSVCPDRIDPVIK